MKSFIITLCTLLLLFTTSSFLFSQQIHVELKEEWKRLEKFEKERLPKSALALLDTIYNAAVLTNDSEAIVKSIIYRLKFIRDIEPDPYTLLINQVKTEIDKHQFPVSNILNSIVASLYDTYLENNYYKISSRTEIINSESDEIETWSTGQFITASKLHFEKSLTNKIELQKIPVGKFSEILIDTNETIRLRPTLFDLLAHRFLDYLQTEKFYKTKPVYEFEIKTLDGFLPAEKFLSTKFVTSDSTSNKFAVIQLYKELIKFHLEKNNIDALIDIDLWRLLFFYINTINDEKDTAFLNSLNNLIDKYKNEKRIAIIHLEKAALFFANENLPYPDKYLSNLAMAKDICEFIIDEYPDTKTSESAKSILSAILKKEYNIDFENTTLPGKPFRGKISFKNINSIHLHILKLENDIFSFSIMNEQDYDSLLNTPPALKFSVELPLVPDYLTHSVEFPVEGLSNGKYLIITYTEEENQKTLFSHNTLSVTGISYFYMKGEDDTHIFYIRDALTGMPIKNAVLNAFEASSQKQTGKLIKTHKSDTNGIIKVLFERNNYNYRLQFINGKDIYNVEDIFYSFSLYRSKYEEEKNRTYFFTERSIYRPGQTFYYKGITINEKGRKEREVVKNHKTTIIFYDANNQKISEQQRTTNDYGSFEGSFIIPQGLLTGNYRIQNEYGSASFSVEEYKKPLFEVTFNPVKDNYRVNDSITVTGSSRTYSDAPVSNAIVKYRVVRNARFPFWGWWRGASFFSPDKEIMNGTSTTDSNGEFSIAFLALPDLTIPQKDSPIFTYSIFVDVTDIAGETRSNRTIITAGYTSLELQTDVKNYYKKDDKNIIVIKSSNLSGEFIPANGTVIIEKLNQPKRLLRERLWEKPDKFIMTEKEFINLFPGDIFNDEDEIQNWSVEREVYNNSFLTSFDRQADSINIDFAAGAYKIKIISKDTFGTGVETENYFFIFSENEPGIISPNIFIPKTENAEPGNNAVLYWGSAYSSAEALLQVYHNGKIIDEKRINSEKKLKKISIPVKEEHRGGLQVIIFFTKENRFYRNEHFITVPWTNKELDISFETFRDKLNPGQEEEWSINIKSKMKDQISAELALTMFDASLDQFRKHNWFFNIWNQISSWIPVNNNFGIKNFGRSEEIYGYDFTVAGDVYYQLNLRNIVIPPPPKPTLSYYSFVPKAALNIRGGRGSEVLYVMDGAVLKETESLADSEIEIDLSESDYEDKSMDIELRKNLNETAFFFPQLKTNENGDLKISFKMPDALTRWQLLGLAHTKNLKTGLIEKNVVTQKDIMVVPHLPRFFRSGDTIYFSATIYNLTDENISGKYSLEIFDARTINNLTTEFGIKNSSGDFTVRAKENNLVVWKIVVPENIEAVIYRVQAVANRHSDGQEGILPVLSNKMLVTETFPLNVRGNETKQFSFDRLLQSEKSHTHIPFSYTFEMTSNPMWYAVQALPFLDDVIYESSINYFSKYFSNKISSHIVRLNPDIKRVFDQWKMKDDLKSNLEKNEELKNILLQETPWVLNAQNETERKNKIAILFDENYINNSLRISLQKLKEMQTPDGGFSWFSGMPSNLYVTQFILNGLGYLKQLNVVDHNTNELKPMIMNALHYYDREMKKQFDRMVKTKNENRNPVPFTSAYVYVRSFFMDIPVAAGCDSSFLFFKKTTAAYWNEMHLMQQAMTALALHRFENYSVSQAIMRSLKERALFSDELGVYWKENSGGFYWYAAPIETQALLIEAFSEILNDQKFVEEMKIWLLKNKQVQDWKTSIATAKGVYALLMRGDNLLKSDELVTINIAGENFLPAKKDELEIEAGTGYFKNVWLKENITPSLGEIEISNPNKNIAWGGLYYQYFEQLDKIEEHQTELQVKKEYFIERITDLGPVLESIQDKKITVGDLVKVRIEIRVDRDMDFIHLKDMRGAGFEPVNVLSQTKYQGGLIYYESTKDASTNFFFQRVPKGTYVFEYQLRAAHKGNFSLGIATLQSLYAPEYSGHTDGGKITIE